MFTVGSSTDCAVCDVNRAVKLYQRFKYKVLTLIMPGFIGILFWTPIPPDCWSQARPPRPWHQSCIGMATPLISQLAGKSVLVVGGAGALGSAALSLFGKLGANTISVDHVRQPAAGVSLLIRENEGWVEQVQRTRDALNELRRGKDPINLVWCAAGGWAGGWVGDEEDAGLRAVESMWKVNALSSVMSVHLASHVLDDSGLLVLTGANAALHGTPSMVGYGMSKAATHHLLHSVAHEERTTPGSWNVAAILPTVIDTPANREAMGTTHAESWVKPEDIANKVAGWVNPGPRPQNGAMISVSQSKGRTFWREVEMETTYHT
ncbi:unnamed protein product [Choristocarpus tenellus]